MPLSPPAIDLDATRMGIIRKIGELRRARGWTQADLASRLGLSQARLSVIERGGGTISAEQFIALLSLFNVGIEEFLPRADAQDQLQAALARLGALHLLEHPDVVPTSRFGQVREAIREVLTAPGSPRLVAALAPIVVCNIDALDLSLLHADLAAQGRGHRVGWLADNVRAAVRSVGTRGPGEWQRRGRRTLLAADDLVAWAYPLRRDGDGLRGREDLFDADISTERGRRSCQDVRSDVSRRWGVLSVIEVQDFTDALRGAHESG